MGWNPFKDIKQGVVGAANYFSGFEDTVSGAVGIRSPNINEIWSQPIQAIGDLFSQRDSIGADRNTADSIGGLGAIVEDQARSAAYKEAVTGYKEMDQTTRAEIDALFTARAAPGEILKLYNAAKENKGLYAQRRKGQELAKVMESSPGRASTVTSTKPNTVLGGGRGY
jgi:hypothetical protein